MIASTLRRAVSISRPLNQSARTYYPSTAAQRKQVEYLLPAVGLVPIVALWISGMEDQTMEIRQYQNTISGGSGPRPRNETVRTTRSEE